MSALAWSGKWHPLAQRFPMLPEDDLWTMAASIREIGQVVACLMDEGGLGLDGRNREAACVLAGVETRWEVYEGDPITLIVEVNAERRHLTTGQRAMAVAIGLDESGKRRNGRFERGSVPTSRGRSNWPENVARAGLVLDHARELADPVLAGELALDAAHKRADERKKEAERIAELGGDLAKLVKTGVVSVDEAVRRADEERRLALLSPDLVERIRDDKIDLREAEEIAAGRAERFAIWVADVERALKVLVPMADGPLPPEFEAALAADSYTALAVAHRAWREERGTE